jgi:two-component system chemotaxis response regulator CheY
MRKLLVVDDDEMVRTCVTACLTALGYEVIQAENGLDAIDKYSSMGGEISLVIMDATMPKLDGINATRKIKELNPTSKVILMSGSAERPLTEVNPDAFLSKPFGGKELYQAIRHILAEHEISSPMAS